MRNVVKLLVTGVAGLVVAICVFAYLFLGSTRTNMDPKALEKEAVAAIEGAGGAAGLRRDADQLLAENRAKLKTQGSSWIRLNESDLTNYPALMRLAKHQGTLVRGIFDSTPPEFSIRILTPGGRLFLDFPDQAANQKAYTNKDNIEVAPGIIVHR